MIWTPEKEEIEREGDTTEDGAGSSSATKESTQSSFSSKKRSSELSGSDEPGKKDKEKHNSRPTSIGPDKSHPKKKDRRASEKVKNGKPGRVNEF